MNKNKVDVKLNSDINKLTNFAIKVANYNWATVNSFTGLANGFYLLKITGEKIRATKLIIHH